MWDEPLKDSTTTAAVDSGGVDLLLVNGQYVRLGKDGRCYDCGRLVAEHFDAKMRKVPCPSLEAK